MTDFSFGVGAPSDPTDATAVTIPGTSPRRRRSPRPQRMPVVGRNLNIRVDHVIDRFMVYAAANNRFGPQALVERRSLFEDFCGSFGDQGVEDCIGADLHHWIDRHDGWKSAATRRSRSNWIKAPFNWAVRNGLIARNPFAAVTYDDGALRDPVADADFWKVWKWLRGDNGFRRFLIFLRMTGCRAGEASALTWPDIDFERGVAVLRKHKSKKKTRKPRLIVLTSPAVKLLRWLKKRAKDPDGPVFVNKLGNPWRKEALDTKWDRLRVRTGIPLTATLHGIRHAFGKRNCKRKGANIKLVSLAMGHSSIAVTEKYYCHLDNELDAIRGEMT